MKAVTKKWRMTKKRRRTLDELATAMINEMRQLGKKHLLSSNSHNWQSAYLSDGDIIEIETATGKKVKCDVESGEYFYQLAEK